MYSYKTEISAQEHDSFVTNSPQTNLLQSANWAKVKDNWDNLRVGFYKDDIQVGSASILIKPLPLGFTMLYIPRGPIMDYTNKELVAFVLKSLKKIGKSKRALFVKFDPAVLLKSHDITEDVDDDQNALKAIKNLTESGAHWTGKTMEIADSIQPRFQANCYTKEDITSSFPKKTRYFIKQGEKRNIIKYRSSIEDIATFSDLIALTEQRKNINLRNHDYFKKLMSIYKDDAYLYLTKLNITEQLAYCQKNLQIIEQELQATKENQKKRITKLNEQKNSLLTFINELKELKSVYHDEVAISGILAIRYGDTMEMLYGGMNNDFKKYYPQYLLYDYIFQNAYLDGIRWVNMGGIEGDLQDGLATFKSHFNPKIEEYIGEFNLPTSVLYHLSNFAYTLRKKLRHKH